MELPPQEQERVEKRRQLVRRVTTLIIGIFLLFLMLSYLPMYHIWYILEGNIVSTQMNNHELLYKDRKITFTNSAYEQLKELYLKNQKAEFSVCLIGYTENKNAIVASIKEPRTISSSVFHVTSDLCDDKAVVALHTHPYKSCIFSQEDIQYYRYFKERNPEGMIALMCAPDKFTLYRE